MSESFQHHSYVPKSSDMMFATLQAFGLAEFFRRINQSKDNLNIFVEEFGGAFRISVNVTIEEMESRIADEGLPNILPALIPADLIVEPEEGKKPRYDSILSRYLPDNFQGKTIFYTRKRQSAEENPFTEYLAWDDPLFPVWEYLCSFNNRSATRHAYPLCIHAWHAHMMDISTTQGLFDIVVQLYDGISDKNLVEKAWAKSVKPLSYRGFGLFWQNKPESRVTALSILSPSTVKGYQSSDARMGISEKFQTVFWLEFYFAVLGFLCVAMPFNLDQEGLLLAYPQIQHMNYLYFCAFMESYRTNKQYQSLLKKSYQYSLEKTELLAGLLFFDSLVDQANKGPSQTLLDVAFSFYKQIGRSYTPFGSSLLLQKDLQELGLNSKVFVKMIEAIPKKDRILLSCLNNAIRYNYLGTWLDFFSRFNPAFNFPKLHKNEVKRILLQADGGITMIKKPTSYAEIFENEGFMIIAEAINTCTERAAYLKSIGRDTNLEVWHNLDQRLLQHANEVSRFIPDLAEFILDYQKEMSRIRGNNKYKEYVRNVSLAALKDLYPLIDKFGSSVVAYSLVAAGYSSHMPRKMDEEVAKLEPEEE